jgi:F-type H+-transporting ATPase subunit b
MKLLTLAILLASEGVFAAGGGHGAIPTEVPRVVLFQALNLGALLLILGYIVVPKLRAHFEARRSEYFKTVREMEEIKSQAERQSQDLRARLEKLRATATSSLEKSRHDANQLQAKLVEEAREQAEKLKVEAQKTIEAETYRAVQSLRAEVITDSMGVAREKISSQIKDSDQKRLQKEFVEKVRVAER